MKIPLVDLEAQYNSIQSEVDRAILDAVRKRDFILGSKVIEFEHLFAKVCGTQYCAGVSSGTSALQLALKSLGVGEGDEVITAANTFIATAEAISTVGAVPVLVDCTPDVYTIDPALVEKAITKKTKAIIPVHLYGQCADMDPLLAIAKKHKLFVIEDACQAHMAEYKGKKAGSIGDIGCFSFYPGKNLGAYGDAGAVTTNNQTLYEKICMLRDHGRGKGEKYTHTMIGENHRIDTIQGAVLCVKMPHLAEWTARRREHAALYTKLLSSKGIICPVESDRVKHVYHLYVVRVQNRDTVLSRLHEEGIGAGIHYPVPLHQQPAYSSYKKFSFPLTEQYAKEILSLPLYPEMTKEMVERIVGLM